MATSVPFGTTIQPTVTESQPAESTATIPSATADAPPAGEEDALTGRFTFLRFAISGHDPSQTTFPEGTRELYAVWDYEGMQASDTVTRVWYLNNEVYAKRVEQWNITKYGPVGTVRDVFLYDYIDGIDVGQWRVEVYLNEEKQVEGTFTVGGS